jgi:hypothetical protein
MNVDELLVQLDNARYTARQLSAVVERARIEVDELRNELARKTRECQGLREDLVREEGETLVPDFSDMLARPEERTAMDNPTALKCIEAYLKEHGYDGLYSDECGCRIGDLAPCSDMDPLHCRAGYNDPEKAKVECARYWMVPDRPSPPKWLIDALSWYCDECGEQCNPTSPDWRCAGGRWQHCHGYPVGHVDATRRDAHAPDCALALNARHECSCGVDRELGRTTGDQNQVECPACGKTIHDLWNMGDGAVCENARFDCGHCGTDVRVEAATVAITLVVDNDSRKAGGGTRGSLA